MLFGIYSHDFIPNSYFFSYFCLFRSFYTGKIFLDFTEDIIYDFAAAHKRNSKKNTCKILKSILKKPKVSC